MAHLIRSRLLPLRFINSILPRLFLPDKTQRACFHVSLALDAKGKPLNMPSLSPTMESGTIVKWLKKEGDPIQPGDAIADIQTDKAVITMECDDEGILAKIIIPEGTKNIQVGQLIALTVEEGEDWKSVEIPDASSAAAPSSASPKPEVNVVTSGAPEAPPPGQQNIAMPALSPTMTSGTIVRWLKKEGDEVAPGEAVAEIQTDKAVMAFEMEEECVLAKIMSPENSQVEVGQIIAIMVEKDMDWKNVVIPTVTKVAPAAAAAAEKPQNCFSKPETAAKSATADQSTGPAPSGQVFGLAVKRLLEEYGLSSTSVKGSGRGNRLLKSDVLSHIERNNIAKLDLKAAKPAAKSESAPTVSDRSPTSDRPTKSTGPSTFKDVEVSNIRAVIAKRLGESKRNIPHSYASIDINIDKLMESRSQFLMDNVKLSVNDFITKAVALALVECPDMNILYQNGQVVPSQSVDISMAVAAPTGLITPIIFNAASKRLPEISNDIKQLAAKAREGKLQPHEFQGGSFTISNLGMFGITEFSAIINPPQTAILAVGTGREILDTSCRKVTKMTVRLSYDGRAIDEDQAGNFLETLQSILENPTILTVGNKYQTLRYKRI